MMYEESVQQLVKESRRKVHEANQAKLESDHRLRNAEYEALRRTDLSRNAENEAIARLRLESLQSTNYEMMLEHYENLFADEKHENEEVQSQLAEQELKLRTVMNEGLSAVGGGSNQVLTGAVENQVKIAGIRAQDMNVEMNELVVANNELRNKIHRHPMIRTPRS